MTWFETLTGFGETSPSYVRQNLSVDGETLTSHISKKVMICGSLETPSLAELRERVQGGESSSGRMAVRQEVADVQALHTATANAHALFQVASQFNLLEMTNPSVTPEAGIGIYEYDHTQGPACAIAAGAGTIYRNYFASVNGQIGQSESNQIDCLADLGKALGNTNHRLWQMRNGYALPSVNGLSEIAKRLRASSEAELDQFRQQLRVGLQWNTQVTLKGCTHTVSQIYCSALPVAYANHPHQLWEPFARLVLEAAYEATLCTAILNGRKSGSHRVFLTLLGGGAFGNEIHWIIESMTRALTRYRDWNIEVVIVSYRYPNEDVQRLIRQFPG